MSRQRGQRTRIGVLVVRHPEFTVDPDSLAQLLDDAPLIVKAPRSSRGRLAAYRVTAGPAIAGAVAS